MADISFAAVEQTFRGRTILGPIDAVLTAGTVTVVTGENGSGKSTLLKLAGRLLLPTKGAVTVQACGREISGAALRAELALLTPELRFYPRLTAKENLQFLLGLRGITLAAEQFSALLERVGLPERTVKNAYAGEFSTGMRQRLKLAVLLASGAHIWLLDEPGANLDAAGRALILREARQAAAEQRLVLWATNDSREEGAADACIHLSGD